MSEWVIENEAKKWELEDSGGEAIAEEITSILWERETIDKLMKALKLMEKNERNSCCSSNSIGWLAQKMAWCFVVNIYKIVYS